ncbi:MAG: Ig-like domain-containing protein [Eubacteriaceae bacterium]|nr:Ig-like domain-containing protein [Eubacteriaceae bacterium]
MKKSRAKIFLTALLIMAMFLQCATVFAAVPSVIGEQTDGSDKGKAAEPKATASVTLWRPSENNHFKHSAMAIGSFSSNIKIVMKNATLKSAAWSSSNTAVATISGNNSTATIRAIKEGTSTIKVTVKTTGGDTVTDTALISVYTPVSTAVGKLTAKQNIYMGAATSADVRAVAYSGQDLMVVGACGSYYFSQFPANFVMNDSVTHKYGFVAKSAVNVPVTGISLNKTTMEISKKQRKRLTANVLPQIANNQNVTWSSSNSEVASVTNDGIVTGKSDGTAEITATAVDGGKTAKCVVTVAGDVVNQWITLSKTEITIRIDDTERINASEVVLWKSSNSGVATVINGTVVGKAPGDADITAYTADGRATVCKVKVLKPGAPTVKLKKLSRKKYRITWKRVPGVSGYQVYKYNSKKKKYSKAKTISKNKEYKITYTGAKGTYKVRSYKKSHKKVFYSPFAKAVKNKNSTATYTVYYYKNGGTGSTYKQKIKYNNKVRLTKNKFSRSGYAFVGWSTSPRGGVKLKNGTQVQKLTKKTKIKLYAVWTGDTRTHRRALTLGAISETNLNTSKDIYGMKDEFEKCNFDGERISATAYPDKSKKKVNKKITDTFLPTTEYDISYIYISCHGSQDGSLIIKQTGIEYETYTPKELRLYLDNNITGKVVLMVDSCYSGKLLNNLIGTDNVKKQVKSQFIQEFIGIDSETKELKKTNKYKILTSSGDTTSLDTSNGGLATVYWREGMLIERGV